MRVLPSRTALRDEALGLWPVPEPAVAPGSCHAHDGYRVVMCNGEPDDTGPRLLLRVVEAAKQALNDVLSDIAFAHQPWYPSRATRQSSSLPLSWYGLSRLMSRSVEAAWWRFAQPTRLPFRAPLLLLEQRVGGHRFDSFSTQSK